MKRSIKLERVYPHSIERVWSALTNPDAMATWLMENDFRASLGHKFRFQTKPRSGFDGVVHCEVTELDPPRCLAFSWRGGPGGEKPPSLDTVVRFTLEPVGAETRLILEHTGFRGVKAIAVSFMLQGGWKKMMAGRLAQAIARFDS